MTDVVQAITDPEERRRAIALVAEIDRLASVTCPACERDVCGHQYVMNAAMGFKDAPRCAACLADALEQPLAEFLDRVSGYIHHRACFDAAWVQADINEGVSADTRPCLAWLDEIARTQTSGSADSSPISTTEAPDPTTTWDAGDMSCGDLVLELRMRLMQLEGGAVLELVATDPAAPEDIPAWCKLTGHRLLRGVPPIYHIQRKDR